MRAMWKGSISFGLVNIPINLYTASKDKELKFVLLHKKDHSEIRYARICKAEDKEIPWSEIVKGYEVSKGDFVVFSDEDFAKAHLIKSNTIEILSFTDESEIDSMYYTKPYFLEPGKGAGNAYSLLRDALRKSKKVGIAKYVLRNKEHLAVVKVHEEFLILNDLRFESELVRPRDLEVPATKKVTSKELDIAIQLIDKLTVSFKPQDYQETYTEELKKLIKKKAKGRPIHPVGEEEEKKVAHPKVHDIMSLLQASLSEKKKPSKKTRKTA